tara:strand:+ start:1102 stop:1287 length:186 start_codon:yes stop_codon:yes gene_type:complete
LASLSYYRAEELAIKQGDSALILEAYIGIANPNYKLADYEATSIWAEKTIRLAQKLNEVFF